MTENIIDLGPFAGLGTIHGVAEAAIEILDLASENFELDGAAFTFNDTRVVVYPGESLADVVDRYFAAGTEPVEEEVAPMQLHDDEQPGASGPQLVGTFAYAGTEYPVRVVEILDYTVASAPGVGDATPSVLAEFVIDGAPIGMGSGTAIVSLDELRIVTPDPVHS